MCGGGTAWGEIAEEELGENGIAGDVEFGRCRLGERGIGGAELEGGLEGLSDLGMHRCGIGFGRIGRPTVDLIGVIELGTCRVEEDRGRGKLGGVA